MGIVITHRGNFERTRRFFKKMSKFKITSILNKYGDIGVAALSEATPEESGKTASSWSYSVENQNGSSGIFWSNSNVNEGVNIAIILQYGHGTGTGGYVVGRDYINPAVRPVFDKMADSVWKEVTSA